MAAALVATGVGRRRIRVLKTLPIAGYIYFLIRGEKIVYVGQTVNPHVRISEHRREKAGLFDRVLYVAVPQSRLNEFERSLIEHLEPELNRSIATRHSRTKNRNWQASITGATHLTIATDAISRHVQRLALIQYGAEQRHVDYLDAVAEAEGDAVVIESLAARGDLQELMDIAPAVHVPGECFSKRTPSPEPTPSPASITPHAPLPASGGMQ